MYIDRKGYIHFKIKDIHVWVKCVLDYKMAQKQFTFLEKNLLQKNNKVNMSSYGGDIIHEQNCTMTEMQEWKYYFQALCKKICYDFNNFFLTY